MGRELDDATILSIHRQYAEGRTPSQIASCLGVYHKTVRRYLRGDSKPHPRIARRIASIHGYKDFDPPRPNDVPDGFITLREASRIIPGEPCPEHIAKHTRPNAKPKLRTVVVQMGDRGAVGRTLVTRTDWVRAWNAARIGPHPRGIAIDASAAIEVIDPTPSTEWFWKKVRSTPNMSFKVGIRSCIMLDDLSEFLQTNYQKRNGKRRVVSFPPGFLDAVHARVESSGTRLFVITRDTLASL